MEKPKVIVICGPTASGKTKLSVELAKKIDGEIICCDSMQIYKDMNIGTAKVTKEEMQGIKHYLVDFVLPDQRYSVADYKKDATKAIQEVLSKEKVPIIVGGWEYDEEKGYPEGGIAPGTKWEDVPEDFECPLYNVGKDEFSEVE